MAEIKNQQTKFILILGAVNFLMTVGVIIFLAAAFGPQNGDANPVKITEKETAYPEVQYNAPQKGLKDQEYIIDITDDGFASKGIQALGGQRLNLTVNNKGTKPHSFEIDSLNIDSGPIEPGASRNFVVETLPNDNLAYSYNSSLDSGAADEFSGVLIIIKK